MAVTKLGLYNDALRLLGQRSLSSDTEDRSPRYDLDDLYNNGAVDYCLEVVKPHYASKLAEVVGIAPTAVTGFSYQSAIPTAETALIAVYADGKFEQPITKYSHESKLILSDYATVYIHYVENFATGGLTNMTQTFGHVISAYMAREMAVKIDPDEYESLNVEYERRLAVAKAYGEDHKQENKSLSPNTLTNDWRKIYNDALLILGQDPISSNTDDSVRKNRLDLALDAEIVEAVIEDTGWHFGMQSDQILYDSNITPAWGYTFACEKPATLHRLNGIWSDEFFQQPVRDYIDEDGYIYSSLTTIYIQYVDTSFISDPSLWPSYFKRLVAARMAVDAGPSIDGSNMQNAVNQYTNRRKEAMSTDAIQAPPKRIGNGSWSGSRGYQGRGGNRDRP